MMNEVVDNILNRCRFCIHFMGVVTNYDKIEVEDYCLHNHDFSIKNCKDYETIKFKNIKKQFLSDINKIKYGDIE